MAADCRTAGMDTYTFEGRCSSLDTARWFTLRSYRPMSRVGQRPARRSSLLRHLAEQPRPLSLVEQNQTAVSGSQKSQLVQLAEDRMTVNSFSVSNLLSNQLRTPLHRNRQTTVGRPHVLLVEDRFRHAPSSYLPPMSRIDVASRSKAVCNQTQSAPRWTATRISTDDIRGESF